MRFPGIIMAAALCAAACDVRVGENGVSMDVAKGKVIDEWVRTYPLTPGSRVEIVNENGAIGAEAATGAQLEVRAVREVRGDSDEAARQLLQKLQMIEEVGADHVKIEARAAAAEGAFGRRTRPPSIEYHLRIPRGMAVSLQTQNGQIALENLDGRIAAQTVNGGIVGHGLAGSLRAASVNGGIQADMVSVTGEVSVVSVNGGVRLALPAGVRGQLEASAVNGAVSVDDGLHLARAVDSGRQRVAGTFNGGGPKISVQTTNGAVRLTTAPVAGDRQQNPRSN